MIMESLSKHCSSVSVSGVFFWGGATLLSLPFRFLVQLNLVLSQAANPPSAGSRGISWYSPLLGVQSYYFGELSFAEEKD